MELNLRLDSLKPFSGIRGIACLCVIFYHLTDIPTTQRFPFLSPLLFLRDSIFIKHGDRWVTMFFVLSGFVLTQKYLKGSDENYLKKRIIRIFPLHLFILCLYFFIDSTDVKRFKQESLFYQISLMQSWFDGDVHRFTWNFPAWTLSVEWLLYLMFFCLLVIYKKTKMSLNILTLLVFVCIGLLTLFPYHDIGPITFYLNSDIKSFLIGCFVALVIERSTLKLIFSSKISFLIGILFNYLFFYFSLFNLLSFSFVFLLGTIYYGQAWINKIFISKILGFVGCISFSLYMIHVCLIETMGNLLLSYPPILSMMMYFVSLFIIGIVTSQIFEKKLYETFARNKPDGTNLRL